MAAPAGTLLIAGAPTRSWGFSLPHALRPPVVALYWDPGTGRLSRLTERDDAFLRSLMIVILETDDVAALDRAILDTVNQLVRK
jgi:hypothetical protein